MPTLIKAGAITSDNWVVANEEDVSSGNVLDKNTWLEKGAKGSDYGLLLQGDDEPEEAFLNAPLIAINFSAFNDGRGLSLAVLLLTRFNYRGEIRATGDVHPDIMHYMHRCGFHSYWLPDHRDPDTALAALKPYSDYYQGSVVEPTPAFSRVARGD